MDCCYLLFLLNMGTVVIRLVAVACSHGWSYKRLTFLTKLGIPVCVPELTYGCH